MVTHTEKRTPPPPAKLARQYAAGIEAGYAKMVARVGAAEADKWRANALASAQRYGSHYAAIRDFHAPPHALP